MAATGGRGRPGRRLRRVDETSAGGLVVADDPVTGPRAPLGIIDFWFVADGRRVHKTVHHFLLRAIGGALSDADIEVTEVAWVPLDELGARLAYADERALVERAPALLADSA